MTQESSLLKTTNWDTAANADDCPNKSANSGGSPPVQHHVSHMSEGPTREANDREQTINNIRVQCCSQAKAVENCMKEGTSQALVKANHLTKSTASLLHLSTTNFNGDDDKSTPS